MTLARKVSDHRRHVSQPGRSTGCPVLLKLQRHGLRSTNKSAHLRNALFFEPFLNLKPALWSCYQHGPRGRPFPAFSPSSKYSGLSRSPQKLASCPSSCTKGIDIQNRQGLGPRRKHVRFPRFFGSLLIFPVGSRMPCVWHDMELMLSRTPLSAPLLVHNIGCFQWRGR